MKAFDYTPEPLRKVYQSTYPDDGGFRYIYRIGVDKSAGFGLGFVSKEPDLVEIPANVQIIYVGSIIKFSYEGTWIPCEGG